MTNKEAIVHLKSIRNMSLGNVMKEALTKGIEALEFAESQTLCCDNCVNRTRKSKEVCTSPYGICEFFEDKTQKRGCNYEK